LPPHAQQDRLPQVFIRGAQPLMDRGAVLMPARYRTAIVIAVEQGPVDLA